MSVTKQYQTKHRYTITINNNVNELVLPIKSYCDILDDAIDIIEKATSMDIDAVFSDGDYRFSIYDNHNRVIVTTNENITHLAVERNEYESETLYTYLREYAADYE